LERCRGEDDDLVPSLAQRSADADEGVMVATRADGSHEEAHDVMEVEKWKSRKVEKVSW
jgi:hypothetical protein